MLIMLCCTTHVLPFACLLPTHPPTYLPTRSEGQVVYHGPRENVMPFFNSLGFSIPARKGVADFLQEVTSRRDQQQYWSGDPSEYRFMPITQFHEAYMRSADGKAQLAALEAPTPQLPDHLDPLVRKK